MDEVGGVFPGLSSFPRFEKDPHGPWRGLRSEAQSRPLRKEAKEVASSEAKWSAPQAERSQYGLENLIKKC
jgi:hypothetical protein